MPGSATEYPADRAVRGVTRRADQAQGERSGPGEVDPPEAVGTALVGHPTVQQATEEGQGPVEVGHHVADAEQGGRRHRS